MKFVKILLGLVLTLILVYFALCFVAPKRSDVSVTQTIKASPQAVFAEIADFKNWDKWANWNNIDPNMKKEYSGPSNAVGTSYTWKSTNKNVGNGWQKIMVSDSATGHFQTQLMFEGVSGTSLSDFKVEPDGAGSKVTWRMYDEQDMPFYFKAASNYFMKSILEKMFKDNLLNVERVLNGQKPVFVK
jgi:hypothetical protein